MVVRILMLLLALAIVVNLIITALSYMAGENLYKKFGKQISIGICLFALFVAAIYVAIMLVGIKI